MKKQWPSPIINKRRLHKRHPKEPLALLVLGPRERRTCRAPGSLSSPFKIFKVCHTDFALQLWNAISTHPHPQSAKVQRKKRPTDNIGTIPCLFPLSSTMNEHLIWDRGWLEYLLLESSGNTSKWPEWGLVVYRENPIWKSFVQVLFILTKMS